MPKLTTEIMHTSTLGLKYALFNSATQRRWAFEAKGNVCMLTYPIKRIKEIGGYSLRQNFLYHVSMDISQSEISPLILKG